MSADLGLSPGQFGQGVSMFFVAYLLFQYPHARLLPARTRLLVDWLVGAQ